VPTGTSDDWNQFIRTARNAIKIMPLASAAIAGNDRVLNTDFIATAFQVTVQNP
jgi:hypothetical protein